MILKRTTTTYFMIFTFLSLSCLMYHGIANPTVMVTNYTIEPETLLPGDDAEVTIMLTNTETTATKTDTDYINSLPVDQTTDTIAATIERVWISSDGDGTHDISSDMTYLDIGDLSPASSIMLTFKITADDNISEGLYFPMIRVNVENNQNVKYPLPVRINNLSAVLLSKDVPKKISSSGSTTITLTAVNNRGTTLDDVTVTADQNQSISVSPVSTYIGTLASETSQDVTCSLHPSSIGRQNISFSISFRNGENFHSKRITLPIEVIETHDVSPVLFNMPSTIPQHDSERITLEVYNAKSDTITGVTVIPVTEFRTSPSEYFIGSMDANDVFSASFDVFTDELDTGNYSMGFKVAFKQGNNFFESPTLSEVVQVIQNSPTRGSTSSGLIIGVGIVVLVGVIVVFYMIRKRRIMR